MTKPTSIVVFLGSPLSTGEYYDDSKRIAALEAGVRAIEQNVAGVQVKTRNQLACSITVFGPPEALSRLKDFVEESRIGDVETGADIPALRAAGR